MEIGDKVLCIKTNDLNEKDSYYTILELDGNNIVITTNDDPNKQLNNFRHYFIHTQVHEWSKFSDHFVDLKKYRKDKLKKLASL